MTLGERDVEAIRDAFAAIERTVRVVGDLGPTATPVTLLAAGGREIDSAEETRAVLEAVCALSDRVTLEIVEHESPGPWPEVTIGDGLVYRGMPVGYELTTLVYAIVEAGLDEPSLAPESRARLGELDRLVEVRVYVTPT